MTYRVRRSDLELTGLVHKAVTLILLGLIGVFLTVTLVLVVYLFFALDLESIPIPDDSGLKLVVPLLRKQALLTIGIVSCVGVSFVLLILLFGTRIVVADEFEAFGVKIRVSQELRDARQRIGDLEQEVQAKGNLVVSLTENVREIQKVQEHIGLFIIDPEALGADLGELLDGVASCAAFTIRPSGRAVRVSIWLYRKEAQEMRIIASYRVSRRTQRSLTFRDADEQQGFAMEVLRNQRPMEKRDGFTGAGGWRIDPSSNHTTTSVLGQPIQVGIDDAWQAVLCFSTDRDLVDFPNDAFSVQNEAAALSLLAHMTSTAISLGLLFGSYDERSNVGGTSNWAGSMDVNSRSDSVRDPEEPTSVDDLLRDARALLGHIVPESKQQTLDLFPDIGEEAEPPLLIESLWNRYRRGSL